MIRTIPGSRHRKAPTHLTLQAIYPLVQTAYSVAQLADRHALFELGLAECGEYMRVSVQLGRERGDIPIRATGKHPSGGGAH